MSFVRDHPISIAVLVIYMLVGIVLQVWPWL